MEVKMKRSSLWKFKIALVPLLLFPYIVAFSPNPDSSYTTLEFAAGTGSYAEVSRDCSGRVVSVKDVPFQDAGVSVDHYFSSFRVGAKAGLAHNGVDRIFDVEGHSASYFNPNIGLNTKDFGLDVGGLFYGPKSRYASTIFPTGALRFGKATGTYVSFGLANNLPLMTGGGIVDLGLGFNLGRPRSGLWLGLGAGPHAGFSVKGDFPVSDRVLLDLRGQVGSNEDLQYGLSAGTKIIF
jgi:hypothetical protein